MNEYPGSIRNYPKEWLDLLDSLDEASLYAVDCKIIPESIKDSSLALFMQTLLDLSDLPIIPESPEISLEDWAFNGVKKKKRHEIQKIVPTLVKLKKENAFDSVVDIGGGVGHLSRVLSHYHGIPSISLDRDPEFQKIGKMRLEKYRKIEGAAPVEFVNMEFGQDNSDLQKIFKPRSFSLGLHSCGALSNVLINQTIKNKTAGLLSFGCCYHRLDAMNDYPVSEYLGYGFHLALTSYAMTLATRAHGPMTRSDYQTKERVKYYRYGLHLFLMKHFGRDYFTEVGECNIKVYWLPFSIYIRSKLEELKLEHQFSDQDFMEFYESAEIQKELRVMFLCNIIRWQLGRALEVYLLLDRAIYLEEAGYDVTIGQYFNEALSPRNIGILALINK